jgi:hypothetical protein
MRKRHLFVLAIAASLFSARGAVAQSGYTIAWFLEGINADSVFGAAAGDSVEVLVRPYDYLGRGIASFDVTLHFDPARVEFLRASAMCPDSATYPLTVTPVAAQVRLQAAGCTSFNSYSTYVARIWLKLVAGAVDGSVLYLRAAAMTDRTAADRSLDGFDGLSELCHASGRWGDIDGDGLANSRDALIALSSAVGLPTGPFDVTRGDVDYDGVVSSRDALYLLTASIGGYVGGSRIGRAAVDRCAPDHGIGRRLYFVRGNTNPGAIVYGSGLAHRASGDTTYTLVGDSAEANGPSQWQPRVSPDGQSVLFVCYANPGIGYRTNNICRADADGANPRILTGDGYTYTSPDWSVDGTKIVAVRSYQIVVMDTNGTNMAILPGSPGTVTAVRWQPVGGSQLIAYATYTDTVATRTVDSAFTTTVVLYMPSGNVDFGLLEWSPAGDSLAVDARYYRYPYNTHVTWAMAATAGAPPQPRFALSGSYYNTTAPAWTDLGQLFGFYDQGRGLYRVFFLRADGAPFRLMRRDARDHYLPGMARQ